MTRGRTVTRSSSSFTFPGSLLPVLHPPRSVKRHQSPSPFKADIPTLITPPDTPMPAIRNRRRRSTVSLPDVENSEANVPVRSKRKPTPTTLPLSPRTLNTELRGRSLTQNEKSETITDFEFTTDSIQPPSIDQIFSSPRSPRLELSFDEEIPAPSAQIQDSLEPQSGSGLFYMDSFAPESELDDLTTQLEEITVRAARSRAQQRERAARRWETLCSARIRFLKEQASHAVVFAEMAAAATRPTNPTLFNVFGASSPSPPLIVPSSPFGAYGAPLSRMRSPSPYSVCGESLDLAAVSSASGREELEALCDPTSTDSRPLVDRMICRLHEFDYDDISVDGLTEAECRQLRTETRKRRRLDRQRAYELGILLELKRRQIGRSRSSSSSSSSSDSSTSSTSSDSDCEQPASPPQICCPVQSVDHLIAKMHMKRKETGQRTFTSSVVAREVFEARGCSSLRMAVHSTIEVRPKFARKRSHSTKSAFSDIFTLSGSPFGLGSTAWLKEKRRLTSLDRE